MIRVAVLVVFAALPAWAQDALGAAGFDAVTQGKTFVFSVDGEPYGAEEYLPGNKVRWSFLDGRCQTGEWWAQNGQICFSYLEHPEPQCWNFYADGAGLNARFAGAPPDDGRYSARVTDEPLYCMGPDVGV